MARVIEKATADEVIEAMFSELDYAEAKHGEQAHSLATWCLIIQQELDEAKYGLTGVDGEPHNTKEELLQVLALAFAAIMQHGVQERLELRRSR